MFGLTGRGIVFLVTAIVVSTLLARADEPGQTEREAIYYRVWCKYTAEQIMRRLDRNEVIRRADLDIERRWLIGTIWASGLKRPSRAFTPKRN